MVNKKGQIVKIYKEYKIIRLSCVCLLMDYIDIYLYYIYGTLRVFIATVGFI